MAKSELVYEFQGSRNLNTTPIDITGLQGDTYDYELVTFFESEGVNSRVDLTFNNDTTANYRFYEMTGSSSSATAFTSDSLSQVYLYAQAHGKSSLTTAYIKGSSGEERYLSIMSGLATTASNSLVKKMSGYWKNTANKITSIQLKKSASVTSTCHILLYRTLKTASQGNWEKVDELTWTADSSTKSFTGLDGDRDKKYRVVWSGDQQLLTEINNDAGSNYIAQRLRNSNGTISATNSTVANIPTLPNGELIINAETGVKRLILNSSSQTSSYQQQERPHWYTNTATNITSLDCTPTASATGTATLYRMKSGTETDGVLSWELIEEVDVSGDFSAGHTFSGLTGDSEKLYRLEFLGSHSGTLYIQYNGDTGTNYDYQYLRGRAATAAAAATTNSSTLELMGGGDVGTEDRGECIIYPKSGSQRPMLNTWHVDEDEVRFDAGWWSNTINEMTSIKVYANNTNTCTGKLKLWRLK